MHPHPCFRRVGLLGLLSLVIPSLHSADAGSATWSANPPSGDWNTATNWMPNTVPNGPGNIATFETSTKTAVSFSNETEVDSIIFNPGASAFTLTTAPFQLITITGAGLINNSGQTQQFVSDTQEDAPIALPQIGSFVSVAFMNSSSAGSDIVYTANAGDLIFSVGGNFVFYDTSSAGNAIFNIYGESGAEYEGEIDFFNSSTAANATINLYDGSAMRLGGVNAPPAATLANAIVNNNGGHIFLTGGATAGEATIINERTLTQFSVNLTISNDLTFGTGTAGNANITNRGATATTKEGNTSFQGTGAGTATITNEGGDGPDKVGGFVTFTVFNGDAPTAEAATLIANPGTNGGLGGLIKFGDTSTGGTARVEVFGNGSLDISELDLPGVTIGSLEGDGLVFLGTGNLTSGSNDSSTLFSGVIQDGGFGGGSGGSLTKIGRGNLTLTNASSYTGGTTVNEGILLANNTKGSATGKGPVQVNTGTFGGSGAIAGAVTVGTGSGTGAILGPGKDGATPGRLIVRSKLTLMTDATYRVLIKSDIPATDSVSARGVRIFAAQILFDDRGTSVLPPGTVLTVINNTAATAINGAFANLADGSTITIGNNTFSADYQGGDGNDLILTVVP